MTLVNRNAQSVNTIVAGKLNTNATEHTSPTTYKRILVFLDGSRAAERALPKAIKMAKASGASIVIACRNHAGVNDYLAIHIRNLTHQGVQAHGYVVNKMISQPTAWLIASEHADAVVFAQKAAGWFGSMFGGNVAAQLRAGTDADIFTVRI
jgi:nucleotide-binding universal stress UspA family protein